MQEDTNVAGNVPAADENAVAGGDLSNQSEGTVNVPESSNDDIAARGAVDEGQAPASPDAPEVPVETTETPVETADAPVAPEGERAATIVLDTTGTKVREYSLEVHGEGYHDLAVKYAASEGFTVKAL